MTPGLVFSLLVDDDLHQRDTVGRGLRLYGHCCVPAASVDEALTVLAVEGGPSFDLLLTDVNMPGRSGSELTVRVQQDRPDPAVVAEIWGQVPLLAFLRGRPLARNVDSMP